MVWRLAGFSLMVLLGLEGKCSFPSSDEGNDGISGCWMHHLLFHYPSTANIERYLSYRRLKYRHRLSRSLLGRIAASISPSQPRFQGWIEDLMGVGAGLKELVLVLYMEIFSPECKHAKSE